MANLKNESKLVSSTKELTNLIKGQKKAAKGIFSMHRNVMAVYVTEQKEFFEGGVLMVDGRINPIVKDLKDKSFKPFQLLFGTFSLDKVLKAIKSDNFLSFMELYNKSVLTFIASDDNERKRILERGAELNKPLQAFKYGSIEGVELLETLFEYFPTFHEKLKEGKIAPNVAKFIYEHDFATYERLNIANIYDVEHEQKRQAIRKQYGVEGLIKFDNEHKAKSEAKNVKKANNTAEALAQ